MIVRVFRAKPAAGKTNELLQLVKDVSLPFVDRYAGLLARYAAVGTRRASDELVMITVWKDVESLKQMTGEDWESEVIPDQRIAERIDECSVEHYESFA